LTKPPYSDSLKPLAVGSTPTATERLGVAMTAERALERWFDRPGGLSRGAHLALDIAGIGFAILIPVQVAPPELLFHAIFVILIVHAFLFGLAGTLWRIGIVSVALIAYEVATAVGVPLEPMELTEWPVEFVLVLLVAWMADRRTTSARMYASLYRQASDRLRAVQEDERRRLARELHDGVGQTLTALTLTLDTIAGDPASPEADARLASARRLGADALVEVHDVAERLRPARLERIGLAAAIRDLAQRAGLPVRVQIGRGAEEINALDAFTSIEVYRIVQEAVSNVARHSGAPDALIRLTAANGHLRVTVEDRGQGFDSSQVHDQGLGLVGIRERAAQLGADLRIESAVAEGTRVVLDVPLPQAGEGAA
jgi:signal transduction histidine kinase